MREGYQYHSKLFMQVTYKRRKMAESFGSGTPIFGCQAVGCATSYASICQRMIAVAIVVRALGRAEMLCHKADFDDTGNPCKHQGISKGRMNLRQVRKSV